MRCSKWVFLREWLGASGHPRAGGTGPAGNEFDKASHSSMPPSTAEGQPNRITRRGNRCQNARSNSATTPARHRRDREAAHRGQLRQYNWGAALGPAALRKRLPLRRRHESFHARASTTTPATVVTAATSPAPPRAPVDSSSSGARLTGASFRVVASAMVLWIVATAPMRPCGRRRRRARGSCRAARRRTTRSPPFKRARRGGASASAGGRLVTL